MPTHRAPLAVLNRAALPARPAAPGSGFARTAVGDALGLASAAAFPLLTEVGALGYLGVWWAEPHATTLVEREYLMPWPRPRAAPWNQPSSARRAARARAGRDAVRTDRAAGRGADPGGDRRRGDRPRPRGSHQGRRPITSVVLDRITALEWVTAAGYPDEIREWFSRMPLSVPTASTTPPDRAPVVIRTPREYEQPYRACTLRPSSRGLELARLAAADRDDDRRRSQRGVEKPSAVRAGAARLHRRRR